MTSISAVTKEVDQLCDAYVEKACSQKMQWVVLTCMSYLAFALGSIAIYAAYKNRKLYPLIATAVLYPLTCKFYGDGHLAFLKAEKTKRVALRQIERKFQSFLSQEKKVQAPKPKPTNLTDLVKNNAGTISSGLIMVMETATGFPIHTVLRSTTSFLVQQVANQQQGKQQEIDKEVIAVFEMEYRKLVLQAVVGCYERYIDEATILRMRSKMIKAPSLKTAITDHLQRDFADRVTQELKRKKLIQTNQIEKFKAQIVPKVIRDITEKLTDIETGWITI